MTTSQLREHLLGRNRFLTISLGYGEEQFSFLLQGQREPRFVVSSEDGHRGSSSNVTSYSSTFPLTTFPVAIFIGIRIGDSTWARNRECLVGRTVRDLVV
jgi:hypothetical protein